MENHKYTIDFCSGSILKKMIIFVFPLLCTYILQTFFNTADMVIIGRFESAKALAAIGATLNPITLVLRVFIGLATGVNAVAAAYCGAKDHIHFHRGVHTAILIAAVGGFLFAIGALFAAKPLLVLIHTPEDILHDACVYIWIYFLGIPFLMLFNFGCAVLRAAGDSRRPMYFLIFSGLVNVVLNLIFVVVFRFGVAGVAIATTFSNALASVLILWALYCSTDICHLSVKHLKIDAGLLKEILWIGLPVGLNSTFFNIANMLIQSCMNSFGSLAVAGVAAATGITGFISVCAGAFQQAAMTVTAQNFGAKNYKRVARSCVVSILFSCACVLVLSWGVMLSGKWILRVFTEDQEVIRWGMIYINVMMTGYTIGVLMDTTCGCLRGIGCSMTPAVATFIGAFVFRIIWVLWAFPRYKTLASLLMCYPLSWILVSAFNCILLFVLVRKMIRKDGQLPA